MTPYRRRHGLRATVTLTFAVGALAVSAVLAIGTYFSARHQLVAQRESTATRQAYADSALVRDSLLTSGAQVSDVLGSISPPQGALIFLRREGIWYSSTLDFEGPELTSVVQPVVAQGSVGVGWTAATDPHAVVVGIPLSAVGAEYYEVVVADELDRTLSTLSLALAISAGLTTLAGGLVGRMAGRRVLAPLRRVATAATRVSAGDVTTRLHHTDDPDLAPLVDAFNDMVDAVNDRIERDARFAADVSHELRTPVTTLTTSLSLLQDARDLSPQASRAVRLMTEELSRFRRALEDLLVLGRLDAGAQERRMTTVSAGDLARHALHLHDHPDHVAVDETPRAGEAMVLVDRQQVVRAVANLIRNADLHGGGVACVRLVVDSAHVEFHVEDAGPGVRAEDRERIFDRFARAGAHKSGTGSGLGLSIVRQTARNHGGEVWYADRPEGGADFVVRLPVDGSAT